MRVIFSADYPPEDLFGTVTPAAEYDRVLVDDLSKDKPVSFRVVFAAAWKSWQHHHHH